MTTSGGHISIEFPIVQVRSARAGETSVMENRLNTTFIQAVELRNDDKQLKQLMSVNQLQFNNLVPSCPQVSCQEAENR